MGMTQVTFQDEFCFAKQGRCSDIQIAHDGGEPIDLQGLAAKLMTVSGSSHEPGVPLDDTELSSTEVHFSEVGGCAIPILAEITQFKAGET